MNKPCPINILSQIVNALFRDNPLLIPTYHARVFMADLAEQIWDTLTPQEQEVMISRTDKGEQP